MLNNLGSAASVSCFFLTYIFTHQISLKAWKYKRSRKMIVGFWCGVSKGGDSGTHYFLVIKHFNFVVAFIVWSICCPSKLVHSGFAYWIKTAEPSPCGGQHQEASKLPRSDLLFITLLLFWLVFLKITTKTLLWSDLCERTQSMEYAMIPT